MLSLNEAYEIAKKQRPSITSYTEDKTAYIFRDDNMKFDGETVVLKRNGKVLGYAEYIMSYKRKEEDQLGHLSIR